MPVDLVLHHAYTEGIRDRLATPVAFIWQVSMFLLSMSLVVAAAGQVDAWFTAALLFAIIIFCIAALYYLWYRPLATAVEKDDHSLIVDKTEGRGNNMSDGIGIDERTSQTDHLRVHNDEAIVSGSIHNIDAEQIEMAPNATGKRANCNSYAKLTEGDV